VYRGGGWLNVTLAGRAGLRRNVNRAWKGRVVGWEVEKGWQCWMMDGRMSGAGGLMLVG